VCNLVEQWRELGYECGCEDGVDEEALFSVFRPYRSGVSDKLVDKIDQGELTSYTGDPIAMVNNAKETKQKFNQ
jgi:hypothetical protein